MVINWRRNKKKFPVFLLTSIFLLLAIGVFLVNFISIKYTFENASFFLFFFGGGLVKCPGKPEVKKKLNIGGDTFKSPLF